MQQTQHKQGGSELQPTQQKVYKKGNRGQKSLSLKLGSNSVETYTE